MKIIRPVIITDAMITASNVSETDYPEFSMGTTYGEGATIIDSTGLELLTLDVAPATSWVAGDFITGQTSTKTAYVVAQLTSLIYQVRERTGTFSLGEIIGVTGVPAKLADQGAAFPTITAATNKVHKIYESLVAGNIANYPAFDVLEPSASRSWLEIGATNRWCAFDEKGGSQTINTTSITYQITPGVQIDSIALINMDASEVNITINDPVEGEIYNKTTSLLSSEAIGVSAVIDWYSYFFSSPLKKTDYVDLEIPPYLNAIIDITIISIGGIAKVGGLIIGTQAFLGITLNKPSIGITDYSTKVVDAWGNYEISIRSFSKRMACDLKVQNNCVDAVELILALHRSMLLVWVGSELYSSLIIYGFCKDFTMVIDYSVYTLYSLEVEGII